MKKFFAGVLTGILMCIAAAIPYHLLNRDLELKDVKVTQVSGEKIEHSDFDYKGHSIIFRTEAEGTGKIITEIPKTNIPEARYWIENTHAVEAELLLIDRRIYGLSYLKRWNNFSVGGGVLMSDEKFEGVKIQAQYWFSL